MSPPRLVRGSRHRRRRLSHRRHHSHRTRGAGVGCWAQRASGRTSGRVGSRRAGGVRPVLLAVAVTVLVTLLAAHLAPNGTPRSALSGALSGASPESSDRAAPVGAGEVDSPQVEVDRERRVRALSRDGERRSVSPRRPGRLDVRRFEAANDRLRRQADRRSAQLAEERRWVLPLASYRRTAGFGQRSGLWASSHTGVDFAAPSGSPIRSVSAGTVLSATDAGAYGLRTVIRAASGEVLWYCHQSSIDVRPGQVVAAGQEIGAVGASGNVTGSHLHLEVRRSGTPSDPESLLRARGLRP